MLNKRVVVAIATLGSLAIPSVSAISPVAQAKEIAPVVADDASKQVIVDQPRVGDAKITGKVLVTDGQNTQSVTVFFPQRQHSEQVQVTREGAAGTDLVAFEYTVPTLRPLQEDETVVVGIAGNTQTFQTVTVQKALTPEVQPAPEGEQKPGKQPEMEKPETPKPGEKEQQPEVAPEKPGQPETTPQLPQQPEAPKPAPEEEKKPEVEMPAPKPSPAPEGEQKPGKQPGVENPETPKPGEKEQQPEVTPEKPGQPETTPQLPQQPEAPRPAPEEEKKPEVKKPETPKPAPAPKPMPKPEGEKKPGNDEGGLQGSSSIGDFFKTLAALGGLVGVVTGVVQFFTQGFGSSNFWQPLRDFISRFNITL